MAKKNTIKVIGITKNDCITGIEYGLVEITVDSEKLPAPHVAKNHQKKQRQIIKMLNNKRTKSK